jgi:hypothetical protein
VRAVGQRHTRKTNVMTATEYIVMGQKKVDNPDVDKIRNILFFFAFSLFLFYFIFLVAATNTSTLPNVQWCSSVSRGSVRKGSKAGPYSGLKGTKR